MLPWRTLTSLKEWKGNGETGGSQKCARICIDDLHYGHLARLIHLLERPGSTEQ